MSKALKDLFLLRANMEIEPFVKITKGTFGNYFRTFKNIEENVECNHFCCPLIAEGDTLSMNEHYGDRLNALDTIWRTASKLNCTCINLRYDFKLVAGNTEYYTDGDFERIREIFEKALDGTELELFFMVSHFGQLVGTDLRERPEHYHMLICPVREMDEIEYDVAINQFAEKFSYDWLDVKIKTN